MESSLDAELLSDLRAQYDEAEELLSAEDAPTQPFVSRYAARARLEQLAERVEPYFEGHGQGQGHHALALWSHLTAKVGSIDSEVEELQKCQEDLDRALAKIRQGGAPDAMTILPELVCLNQLGILWSQRGEFDKAQGLLEEALQKHSHFKATGRQDHVITAYTLADLLDPGLCSPSSPEREHSLDMLNTHTHYFLAQLFEKTGRAERSAHHCHITLKQQLELKEFSALDWASNAATLSHHYLVSDDFAAARLHLAAARFVAEKHRGDVESREFDLEEERADALEALDKCEAKVNRCCGIFAVVLLQKSLDREEARLRQGEDVRVEDVEDVAETDDRKSDFPSVEMDAAILAMPVRLAGNFEQAREIFLPGQRFFNRAKEQYYTMEEHCTDHVEINQDLSKMHKALVYFEPDLDRRFKMQKRRADLLEAPLKELSWEAYLLVCRQLVFELAEVHECMMDLKLEKCKTQADRMRGKDKINGLIDKSVGYFERYVKSVPGGDDEKTDAKLPNDSVRPCLVAYFHLARLYDKYVLPDGPDADKRRIVNKAATFAFFKRVAEYCEKHPEAEELMAGELPICKEMVKLLPIKIEKMRREYAEANR